MDEEAAALDMTQEGVPEPLALRRALDETGDIQPHHPLGQPEGGGLAHAQVGHERGEGVVGDLGARARDGASGGGPEALSSMLRCLQCILPPRMDPALMEGAAAELRRIQAGGVVNDIKEFNNSNIDIKASSDAISQKMLENLKNF